MYKLTVQQYHDMIKSGTLTDEDPVELLEGVLIYKMPKNPPHSLSTALTRELLLKILPDGWTVDSQEPVTLDDGEPEPDVFVFRGNRREYAERHPGATDVAIIVEVSNSTLDRDRGIKLRSYAHAGIGVYWIINLIDRVVEIYTMPTDETPEPSYRRRRVFQSTEKLPVELDGKVVGELTVADLLA